MAILGARLLASSALVPIEARAQGALAQSGLVGELEGLTIVTDPAKWPKRFKEAPQLAELVKAGKLPPLRQRLPEDLMLIQPVREIGK